MSVEDVKQLISPNRIVNKLCIELHVNSIYLCITAAVITWNLQRMAINHWFWHFFPGFLNKNLGMSTFFLKLCKVTAICTIGSAQGISNNNLI